MRVAILASLLALASTPAMAQEPLLKREPNPVPPLDIRPAPPREQFSECIRRRGTLTLAVLDFCNTGKTLVVMNGRRLRDAPPAEIISKPKLHRGPDTETAPEKEK